MDSSDDIVIRPSLRPTAKAGARSRAAIERRIEAHKAKGGAFWRIARLRGLRSARRALDAARSAASPVRASGLSGMGAGGIAGMATRAVTSTMGAVVMGVLVAAVTTLRLASGKPLEGTGEELNSLILGDLDDEARAALGVRGDLKGNESVARIVGQEGRINSQIRSIANDLIEQRRRREVGASLFRKEFAVNGTLDMLILRGRDAAVAAWKAAGGESTLSSIQGGLDRIHNGYQARKASTR